MRYRQSRAEQNQQPTVSALFDVRTGVENNPGIRPSLHEQGSSMRLSCGARTRRAHSAGTLKLGLFNVGVRLHDVPLPLITLSRSAR